MNSGGGGVQVELPMVAPMYMVAQPLQWSERRVVDWDETREWKYLIVL